MDSIVLTENVKRYLEGVRLLRNNLPNKPLDEEVIPEGMACPFCGGLMKIMEPGVCKVRHIYCAVCKLVLDKI